MKSIVLVVFVCLAAPVLARADGLVADRSTLAGILGASAYTETFEEYSVTAGSATGSVIGVLDNTTVANGQGPGLVGPGISFSAANPGTGEYAQWDAAGYYGAPSTELLFGNSGTNTNTLNINFSQPQAAFGLDVRDFSGFTANLTISVYSTGGTLLYTSPTPYALTGTPIFVGYQSTTGIGSVSLTDTGTYDTWTPIIDNVEFTPIPEPSTVALFVMGLGVIGGYGVRRRLRRIVAAV